MARSRARHQRVAARHQTGRADIILTYFAVEVALRLSSPLTHHNLQPATPHATLSVE